MIMPFAAVRSRRRAGFMSMAVFLLLLFSLASCGGGNQPASAPTPTPAPTLPTGSLSFTTFPLGLPPAALNAPVQGPLPDDTPMHVAITFKLNQAAMDQLNKSGKNVDLGTMGNQVGISDATYQRIKQLFGVSNATLKLDGLHTYLTIDGKASTFAQAFQVKFVIHQLNGRTFYAPTSDPRIPTFIAPQVLAINGLDNFSAPAQPHAFAQNLVGAQSAKGRGAKETCSDAQAAMQAIAHAYGYDQLWQKGWHGEGMTVNLIEFGPIDQSDVQTFGNCVHYQGKISTVDVDGAPSMNNPSDAGAKFEALLDVEMIQGEAPAANIVDYESTFGSGLDDMWTHFNDELRQIINDNQKNPPQGTNVVSISYGVPEAYLTQMGRAEIDQSFQILTQAEHMTVFVASGDCAAFDTEQFNTLAVDYPGVSPWDVDVGGTELQVDNNNNRAKEIAWSDGSNQTKCGNAWGSGGGLSTVYARPDWQKADGVDNQYSNGNRQIPDLSAVAYGLPTYIDGQWGGANGTSAAAPIWASGFTLVNQGLIQQDSVYYNGPETFYLAAQGKGDKQPFYDVTQGSNLHYPATPGWDYATGLGTPNAMDLFSVLETLAKQS